jgi:signal transduction histidine kinase
MSEESSIGLHAHPLSHEININQMQLSWSSDAGMMGAMGIPSALFWLDPSLNSMLSPLAEEVGYDMFRLLVAWSSSQGTREDYEAMVTVFADNFAEGFLAWGAAVGAAGWGRFELPEFDEERPFARVRVRNTWELEMQRKNTKRWGCPFIQGKLIGLFSEAFGQPCWATQSAISYEPEDLFVEFTIVPSKMTIDTELERLREARVVERERDLRNKLDEMTAELQRSLDEMAIARDEARKASEAKSTFLASMSHELRTPLNAILGYTELVQEELLDLKHQALAEDLSKVHGAGKHLLALISQVLELARIERGEVALASDEVELASAIDELVRVVDPLAREGGNELRVPAAEELGVTVRTDALKLRQILINILGNACKFTSQGSISLVFEVDQQQGVMRWHVHDTGIGMSEDQLARIFETFVQGDIDIQRRYGGAGLGLAISHQLAVAMGGEILARSELGKGSSFTLVLPLELV